MYFLHFIAEDAVLSSNIVCHAYFDLHSMLAVITLLFDLIIGVSLPFWGTLFGAACVLFAKNGVSDRFQRIISGFAAGVMVAASVWSLLIPAMEHVSYMGILSFVPAVVGFWLGIFTFAAAERIIGRLNFLTDDKSLKTVLVTVIAVVIHNFPEGMAVGVVYAGLVNGNVTVSKAAALALSIGIAVQNIPEGAIVSLPLKSAGCGKFKAFGYGVLSGVVEPIGAVITILLFGLFAPVLPYFLGFAAGAMLYVVVEELIPNMSGGKNSDISTLFFAAGFSIMMSLDVALG